MSKEQGIYPGSFRPFHNRHLEIVQQVLDEFPTLDLIIAVAKNSQGKNNNFICGQDALKIASQVVRSENLVKRVDIILMDRDNSAECVALLVSEGIGVVFTGSDETTKSLESLQRGGVWNGRICRLNNTGIHAEEVRRLIVEGNNDWKRCVHPSVAEYLSKLANTFSRG